MLTDIIFFRLKFTYVNILCCICVGEKGLLCLCPLIHSRESVFFFCLYSLLQINIRNTAEALQSLHVSWQSFLILRKLFLHYNYSQCCSYWQSGIANRAVGETRIHKLSPPWFSFTLVNYISLFFVIIFCK